MKVRGLFDKGMILTAPLLSQGVVNGSNRSSIHPEDSTDLLWETEVSAPNGDLSFGNLFY